MEIVSPSRRHRHRPQRPWKRSFRKLPPGVLERVAGFARDECQAACVRRIGRQEIEDGVFAHIGMQWDGDKPAFHEVVVPDPANGQYSRINVEGFTIVHKDRPMVSKTFEIITPDWGDWSRGSHIVSWERDVYQRDVVPPRELGLLIELIGEDVVAEAYVFRFAVDEVLDRTAPIFPDRLLFALNLLQENVGGHGVFPSDATAADYLGSLYVAWELLPPGERDDDIARILRGVKSDDPQVRERLVERYDLLAFLRPLRFVQSANGFRHYFGAQFAPDLVVFENVEYGNAVYVMFEEWETLSRKSRTELLAQHPDRVVRIPHTSRWRRRLADLIREERQKRRSVA